jgi:hypothetical protein
MNELKDESLTPQVFVPLSMFLLICCEQHADSSSASKARHESGSGAPLHSGSSTTRHSSGSGSTKKARASGSGGTGVTGPSIPAASVTPSSADVMSSPEYVQLKNQFDELRAENEKLRLDLGANTQVSTMVRQHMRCLTHL